MDFTENNLMLIGDEIWEVLNEYFDEVLARQKRFSRAVINEGRDKWIEIERPEDGDGIDD